MAWRYEIRSGIGLFVAGGLAAAGVNAAVSGRSGGVSRVPFDSLNLSRGAGDEEPAVLENRRRLGDAIGVAWPALSTVRQVHGTEVWRVTGPGAQDRDADALIAQGPGAALAILVADCAPVFLWDPAHRAIGLAHAGWRGTAGRIATRTVAAMAAAFGSHPPDLLAAVGPAIGPCCYEVDEPVLRAAIWPQGVIRPGRPDHAYLDVPGANARFLQEAGVPADRIEVAGVCTMCAQDRLFSHRGSGGRTGRMAAVLALPG